MSEAAVPNYEERPWPRYAQRFLGRVTFFLFAPAAIIRIIINWYGVHLTNLGDNILAIYKYLVHGFVDVVTFLPLHWFNFHLNDITKDLIAISIAMEAIAMSSITDFRKSRNEYKAPTSPVEFFENPFGDTRVVWLKLVKKTPSRLKLFAVLELVISAIEELLSLVIGLVSTTIYYITRGCMKCALLVSAALHKVVFGALLFGLFNIVQQALNYWRFRASKEDDEWGFWYKQSAIHFAWYLLATVVGVAMFFRVFGT